MSDQTTHEWVLPASIPFAELKRNDLEECVYWLLDAMGAKDLEWRIGGTGIGAADGGRDLEARFFVPNESGEITAVKWWIECKGRTGTVESDEVKSAVNNSLAYEGIDCVVIATNTRFSNPTRDWVKEWQKKHPKPAVQLWDHAQLERYLSRHPDVVLRLFSEALSLQGRFQAMESRFWNKIEFVTSKTLAHFWSQRESIDFNPQGMFALIANEFANGNIAHRPWGAVVDPESLASVLINGLFNVAYLRSRSSKAGIDQRILIRAFAYLILAALDNFTDDAVARMVIDGINREEEGRFPDELQELLLMPIVNQLLSEIGDVCSENCERISALHRRTLTEDNDEVIDYWYRLEPAGIEEPTERRFIRIEKNDAPCVVGFPVNEHDGCPLFTFEPNIKNVQEFMALIKRVATFRKAQARADRNRKTRTK